MKIVHTADIHLGLKYNRLPKNKSTILKEECLINLSNFFERIDDADVLLICGDLFNGNSISSKIINRKSRWKVFV